MAKADKDRGKSPRKRPKRKARDPELRALGARVHVLRTDAGLTQEQVADAAGLHVTYVGQIERAGRNLTYKSILSLARGLGVEPARLVQDDR